MVQLYVAVKAVSTKCYINAVAFVTLNYIERHTHATASCTATTVNRMDVAVVTLLVPDEDGWCC
jgi:hypothetical protein